MRPRPRAQNTPGHAASTTSKQLKAEWVEAPHLSFAQKEGRSSIWIRGMEAASARSSGVLYPQLPATHRKPPIPLGDQNVWPHSVTAMNLQKMCSCLLLHPEVDAQTTHHIFTNPGQQHGGVQSYLHLR